MLAMTPVFSCASPIIYHVDYENKGVLLIGTITTNGKLGTLTSDDIVDLHLLVSTNGLPGFILLPFGYTFVQIQSTPVTATEQGLYFDTANRDGYLKISDNLWGYQWILLQNSTMTIGAVGEFNSGNPAVEPISGNYELATLATPPPVSQPPVRFHTEADAIYGTVTNTVSGMLPNTVSLYPVDQSALYTDVYTDSNHVSDASKSQSEFGVLVYNFRNIDNSTQLHYTGALDDGIAEAKTGEGSLLGGLIYWQSHDDRLTCNPNNSNPKRVDCAATETITGLLINRAPVHHGKYSAGTSFPVFGSVNDPNCSPGRETFSGYLFAQESQITGLGTSGVTVSLTGMHLLGDAVCSSPMQGSSFTTHYDLAVGGPSLPSYDTGSGNSTPPNTEFAVQMQ